MLNRLRHVIVFIILVCLQVVTSHAQSTPDPATRLTYLTEEFKPYNYTENNNQTGLAVDLLKKAWMEINVTPQPLHFLPWTRAYEMLESEKNIVLFSMLKTPERENLFKWAGPIALSTTFFYAKADSPINIQSFTDAQGLSVGIVKGYASEGLLAKKSHIVRIKSLKSVQACINMLISSRVDLISLEARTFNKAIRERGLDPDNFKTVWKVSEMRSYYAFSKDVPDTLVDRFQKAIDRVRSSSAYENLVRRYLH